MAARHRFSITSPATPNGLGEALELIFSRFDPQQAAEYRSIYQGALDEGAVQPQWVLAAHDGGRLLGAAMYQLHPGRTALVWPPRLAKKAPPQLARYLMAEIVDRLRWAETRLATILLHHVDSEERQLLTLAQFAHIAELVYLVSFRQDFPFAPPETELAFEVYTPRNHARLAAVVLATYEGSLDCPALDGVRDIEDILAGYRATGTFVPDYWAIVRHHDQDVGCVLLADHPREDSCELVYMGVVAPMRGRGWGRQVVRWAQWQTRRAGRGRLVAAVDAANHPAVDLYAGLGFSAWDRRQCFARVFGD